MLTSRTNKKPLPQALLGIVSLALSFLGFSTSSLVFAQTNTTTPTTIVISEAAKTTNAKRLGINLGTQNYWDSGMMKRNLAFNNPGFEGESWQSILHCKVVTANTCTDDDVWAYWPANFFANATASFIVGPAAGTTATVTASTAPVPGVTATTLTMSGLSVAPSVGDYVVVRMEVPGNAGAGWWLQGSGETYSTETTDLSPNTPGKQALVVNASAAGAQAVLATYNDGIAGESFLQINGSYTVSFRAKSTGGSTNLHINFKRAVASPATDNFFDRDVTLTNQWQDYSFTYQLSEPTPQLGTVALTFTLTGGSMYFDDAALTEGAAANNPTAFRNSVVSTLQALHPGTIRYQDANNWGSSIDNLLAPDFARERAGYSFTNSEQDVIAIGLHDFLVLCQTVGADPWFTVPTGMTTQEMSNLMDYFGGSTSTVYGAKRAALGQATPWTQVFGQIHLEFGNEVWNTANAGALMTDPASYGKRAGVIFTTAKSSASYNAKSFDLILDGFGAVPAWTETALQNSKNYDTSSIDTYSFTNFADASSVENIFGPMLAEPELVNSSSSGLTAQNAAGAASAGPTPANLAVYETNINTTTPSTTQAQVNAVVPSLGAGLSVAANMLLAQRDLGVTIQNMYALTGYRYSLYGNQVATVPIWGAVVDMGGATNLRRPTFLSEQLANSAILPTLLSTSQSGSNPTWNQAYTTNDDFSLSGAHYIQSVAYTDGTTLNVVLFNLSRTSALPVNFAGLNTPMGTATVSTLTASSIEANNESASNVAITTTSQSLVGGSTMTLPPYSMTVVSVPAPVIPILVSSVTASCANSSLSPSGTTTCSSTVAGQGKYSSAVTWSTTAGTISSTGAYTAPATLPSSGKAVITATSTQDTTKSGSFTISLAANTVTGVTASCPATSVNQGAVIKCSATVVGTGGFSSAYTWSASAGTIASTGSFTAPSTGTSVVLTATSVQDPTKSGTVTLTLNPVLLMAAPTAATTSTTATLNWSTNVSAFGGVSYGTTTSLGLTSPWVNYQGTTHSVTLTGLAPSTTYYVSAFSFVGSQTVTQTMVVTTTNGAASVSGVTVSCSAASLLLGASTGCSAAVQGSGSYSSAVTWSTSLGSISSTGVLTAPLSLTASSITVTARSVQDPTKSGAATLTLYPPNAVTAVSVACQATTITDSSSTTCTPTVTTTGTISTAVTWSASAGTITSTGVLTAPKTGSSVTVTATSVANPSKSGSMVVTLTPLPTITGVTVACPASSLSSGGNTLCTATVAGTGSYTSAVTWSASTGSITSAGSYTAPSTGGSVTITATSTQDPTKSGSVVLQLNAALAMNGVTTSVTSTTATITWTTNLSAFGGVAYGTSLSLGQTSPWVNYQGTTHSITITGLNPSTTYYLSAFSYLANQTAISQSLTITTAAATPTVTGVSVSCQPTTLVAGKSEVCTSSVAGTGSYSSAVTWSTSAGSITSGGVLTAPTTGTSVTVKATSVQDPTKSATATITVTPASTVSAVTLSCPVTMLPVGQSITCGATVAGTGSPSTAVTWSASAGSITSGGAFTAPTSGSSTTLTATSTQDPTKSASIKLAVLEPQAIVNPNFIVSSTTIVVSWNLTELAYSSVSYIKGNGTNAAVSMPQSTTAATTASFTISGLTPGTTYNLTLVSNNKWGTVSQTKSVTTSLK